MNSNNLEMLIENSILNFGDTYIEITEEMLSVHDFPKDFEKDILKFEKTKFPKSSNKFIFLIASVAVLILIIPVCLSIIGIFNVSTENNYSNSNSETLENSKEDNIPTNNESEIYKNSIEEEILISSENDNRNENTKEIYKYSNNSAVFINKENNTSISSKISEDNVAKLTKILENKEISYEVNEEIFTEESMFTINYITYVPSLNGSNVLYFFYFIDGINIDKVEGYIYLSMEETKELHSILEEYGFVFSE